MAHPYTTIARVRRFAIAQHVNAWIDRDGDGTADDGVMDDAIERACNEIDSRLGFAFEVPFRTVTDTPATDGKISDIADRLAVYYLLEPIDGVNADEVRRHWEIAQAELDRIAKGEAYISETPRSTQARRPVRWESAGTAIAGRVDGDYTSTGTDKGYGI